VTNPKGGGANMPGVSVHGGVEATANPSQGHVDTSSGIDWLFGPGRRKWNSWTELHSHPRQTHGPRHGQAGHLCLVPRSHRTMGRLRPQPRTPRQTTPRLSHRPGLTMPTVHVIPLRDQRLSRRRRPSPRPFHGVGQLMFGKRSPCRCRRSTALGALFAYEYVKRSFATVAVEVLRRIVLRRQRAPQRYR